MDDISLLGQSMLLKEQSMDFVEHPGSQPQCLAHELMESEDRWVDSGIWHQ